MNSLGCQSVTERINRVRPYRVGKGSIINGRPIWPNIVLTDNKYRVGVYILCKSAILVHIFHIMNSYTRQLVTFSFLDSERGEECADFTMSIFYFSLNTFSDTITAPIFTNDIPIDTGD